MFMKSANTSGFSLIELMIAVAVLGILIAYAVPAFSVMIANRQVRTAAEALSAGLQQARLGAVQRNELVELILTNSTIDPSDPGQVLASTSGKSWLARIRQTPGTYSAADFIAGRSVAEGASSLVIEATSSSFVFNGMGRLTGTPLALASINITHPSADRSLRVTVTNSGSPRLCDPKLPSTNLQGC